MKRGTEGNHLLPSGSSDGVWGMNLVNEKQRDRPAGLPACPHGFSREGQRGGSPTPGTRPRVDPQRTGIQAQRGHRRLGQLPGNSGWFSRSFPKGAAPDKPRSQGRPCVPTPGQGPDLACFSSGSVLIAAHKYCSPGFILHL